MILSLAASPFPVLLFLAKHRGAVRLDGATKRGGSRASLPLLFAFISMGMRALQDFHLVDSGPVWLMAAPPALGLGFVIFSLDANPNRKKWAILFWSLFSLAFTAGALKEANCLFDDSRPQSFTATVTGKRVSSGKSTTYHLTLSPWGPVTRPEDIQVPFRFYGAVAVNEKLELLLRPGRLGYPWFAYRKMAPPP
jgi:hypothetical protein